MPMAAISAYTERLPARLNELRAIQIEAAQWPWMSEGQRRDALERHGGGQRSSRSPSPVHKRLPLPLLSQLGIGVRYVRKKVND